MPAAYRRIVVLGNTGGGKSHLSKELAAITGHPLFHLDNLFWKPGWVKTPKDEMRELVADLAAEEQWIIDGNYRSTLEIRFVAADLVILMDTHPLACQINVLKRHGKKRSDLPEYLAEHFDLEFLQFCKLLWNFRKSGRKSILELHAKYPQTPFLIVKNRREAKKLLARWRAGESIL